jgi:hypothetical protein
LRRRPRDVAHLRDLRPRCEPRLFLIARRFNFFALISAPAISELCRKTGGILGWPPVDMNAGPSVASRVSINASGDARNHRRLRRTDPSELSGRPKHQPA